MCRLCWDETETSMHIVAECPALAESGFSTVLSLLHDTREVDTDYYTVESGVVPMCTFVARGPVLPRPQVSPPLLFSVQRQFPYKLNDNSNKVATMPRRRNTIEYSNFFGSTLCPNQRKQEYVTYVLRSSFSRTRQYVRRTALLLALRVSRYE